jgi:Zn-dependent protease with chaperone function
MLKSKVALYGLGITLILVPLFLVSWDILFALCGLTEHAIFIVNWVFFAGFLLAWLTASYHIQKCYRIIDILSNTDPKYDILKQWASSVFKNNVKIFLYNDASPNAFAIDTGFVQRVYLSVGLLELADDIQVQSVLKYLRVNMDSGITLYQTLVISIINAFVYTPYTIISWVIGHSTISELLATIFNFIMAGIPLALTAAINRELVKHGDTLFKKESNTTDVVALSLALKNSVMNARKYSISREPELISFITAGHNGLFATHPTLENRMLTLNS